MLDRAELIQLIQVQTPAAWAALGYCQRV